MKYLIKQLIMSISFIWSNGSDETRNIHTKSNNIDIMMGKETDEIIDDYKYRFSRMIKK